MGRDYCWDIMYSRRIVHAARALGCFCGEVPTDFTHYLQDCFTGIGGGGSYVWLSPMLWKQPRRIWINKLIEPIGNSWYNHKTTTPFSRKCRRWLYLRCNQYKFPQNNDISVLVYYYIPHWPRDGMYRYRPIVSACCYQAKGMIFIESSPTFQISMIRRKQTHVQSNLGCTHSQYCRALTINS